MAENNLSMKKIYELLEPYGKKVELERGKSIERKEGLLPLALICKGRVRVFMESEKENKKTTVIAQEGDFLGETTFYECDFDENIAITQEETFLLVVPFENLALLKKNVPEIEKFIYDSLGRKVKELSNAGSEERLIVDKRIARVLLQLGEGLEMKIGERESIVLKCERDDVAKLAKVNLSTVTGELKVMQIKKLINHTFHRIEILDVQGLRNMIEE